MTLDLRGGYPSKAEIEQARIAQEERMVLSVFNDTDDETLEQVRIAMHGWLNTTQVQDTLRRLVEKGVLIRISGHQKEVKWRRR